MNCLLIGFKQLQVAAEITDVGDQPQGRFLQDYFILVADTEGWGSIVMSCLLPVNHRGC